MKTSSLRWLKQEVEKLAIGGDRKSQINKLTKSSEVVLKIILASRSTWTSIIPSPLPRTSTVNVVNYPGEYQAVTDASRNPPVKTSNAQTYNAGLAVITEDGVCTVHDKISRNTSPWELELIGICFTISFLFDPIPEVVLTFLLSIYGNPPSWFPSTNSCSGSVRCLVEEKIHSRSNSPRGTILTEVRSLCSFFQIESFFAIHFAH